MIPKRKLFLLVLFALPVFCFSQENSPYSRYGIGNLAPQGNIFNRGMGGVSAGFSDLATVNFLNPASYSNLVYTTLDIAAQVDSKTLKSNSVADKYTSNNAFVSYLQLGVPLLNGNKKAAKKNISWGLNFGLRPVSRINYDIQKNSRISNIDSLTTLYEGSGGVTAAFVGTGIRIKNFSFGANLNYYFGNKNYNTRLIFINDTVNYLKSNSGTQTNFGGLSLTGGIQYLIKIKGGALRLGGYGNLQKQYTATQDIIRQTFSYNPSTGSADKLDSIYENKNQKGTIVLPASYGVGFTVEKPHWMYGVDFEATNWNNYSFYGQKDQVQNSWMVKAGFQYFPADVESKKYWNFVKYRAGLYFGPDYITAGNKLPQFGVTAGAGFPLKLKRSFYETQYSVMNISVEYMNRGNGQNNITENTFRIGIGFALGDIWFVRRKYD